jgi:hypothetical protein
MLKCTVSENVRVLAPYDGDSPENIELKPYFFTERLSAPVMVGQTVGGVDVYIDGVFRGNNALVSAESIEANEILIGITNAKRFLTSRFFIIFVLTFLLLFSAYLYHTEIKQLRKKHKNIKFDKLY